MTIRVLKSSQYAYMQTMVSMLAKALLQTHEIELLAQQPLDKILQIAQLKALAKIFEEQFNTKQSNTIQFNIKQAVLPAGKIDQLILQTLCSEAIRIIRPLNADERSFISYWMRRFELQNVKTIIRGKSLNHSSKIIRQQLIQVPYFSYLNLDKLIQKDDISEVLNELKTTPYASISRYALQHFEQSRDVFTAETSINHQFYEGLNKRQYLFAKIDQDNIHQLLGLIIDQLNLIRLLRYRLYYQFSAPQTFFHLISGGLYLKQQQLQQLSNVEKLSQIHEYLPVQYKQYLADCETLQDIEIALEIKIIERAWELMNKTRYSIAQVFIFLVLREKQLSQLHTLIKGKVLSLSQNSIDIALGLRTKSFKHEVIS